MASLNAINKVAVGSEAKTGAMRFQTSAPLDDRFSVKNKIGLICKEVFGAIVGEEYTDKKIWLFQGLSTTVQDTGDTYVLSNINTLQLWPLGDEINPNEGTINYHIKYDGDGGKNWIDTQIARGWTRLAKASELENISVTGLSNVFNWRGIAQGITPDQDTIYLQKLTINGIDFNCVGYEYDFTQTKYFKWIYKVDSESDSSDDDTPAEIITYYTKEDDSRVYTKSNQLSVVLYVKHGDDLYFLRSQNSNQWERLSDGEIIYSNKNYPQSAVNSDLNFSVYETNVPFYLYPDDSDADSSGEDEIFTENIYWYKANSFTEVSNTSGAIALNNEILASSSNNGDVYQIGDKEYASNGVIWVELGSPNDGWIIL